MNETWTEDPSNPTLYGSLIFGNGLFGSVEWTDEIITTVTWSKVKLVETISPGVATSIQHLIRLM